VWVSGSRIDSVCAVIAIVSYELLPKSFLFLEFDDMASARRAEDETSTWLGRIGRHRTAESVLGSASRYKLSDLYKRGKRKQKETIEIVSGRSVGPFGWLDFGWS
jgi:hypothetical protein